MMFERILLADASTLGRTAIVGVLTYMALIFVLRASGKRTLSKMNAFDFVVTVALGSTLATILLNKDVSIAQGVVALTLLVALQFAITWSSVRLSWVRRIVTGEPTLLVSGGKCLPGAMRRERISDDEVQAAARSAGLDSLQQAEAIVLETDGSFSVIARRG
jgi:uncharacterized membrane protein YcaP (DUF421 family)